MQVSSNLINVTPICPLCIYGALYSKHKASGYRIVRSHKLNRVKLGQYLARRLKKGADIFKDSDGYIGIL